MGQVLLHLHHHGLLLHPPPHPHRPLRLHRQQVSHLIIAFPCSVEGDLAWNSAMPDWIPGIPVKTPTMTVDHIAGYMITRIHTLDSGPSRIIPVPIECKYPSDHNITQSRIKGRGSMRGRKRQWRIWISVISPSPFHYSEGSYSRNVSILEIIHFCVLARSSNG